MPLGVERIVLGLRAWLRPKVPMAVPTRSKTPLVWGTFALSAPVSKTVVGGFVHRGFESHPLRFSVADGIRCVSDRGPDLRRNRLVLVVPRSTRANASLPRPLEDFVPPEFPRNEGASSMLPTCSGMGLSALARFAELERGAIARGFGD
jgi:hypothetical protein